jgi:acetyl esterase/lipase
MLVFRAMRARVWLAIAAALVLSPVRVQPRQPARTAAPEPRIVRLWADRAPGAIGDLDEDTPTLTVYLPPAATAARRPTTAVIIAPGGSYRSLSMIKEGREPAELLNSLGIAAFVLKYRLGPRYHHPVQLGDAQRAIRLVRARAGEWGIAPDRIGIFGFSAGGHLASTASTRFDGGRADATDPIERAGSRPDFAILAYPVISFVEPWTHQGSKTNLLGDAPDPALARSLSSETHVDAATPPTFIYQTNADQTVPAENSAAYFLALRKAGVPAELHVFKDGPHGTGLGRQDPALAEWPALLANWLRATGFLKTEHGPLRSDQAVRGWTILSDSEADAREVTNAARRYSINHLQLSHQIVEDLRQIREPKRQAVVRRLIDHAHVAGVQEVVLWDHALYELDYYPAEFRTGPNKTIDLDNPKFWAWLKDDYRHLLDLVPEADGLVLTFIETGARAERQHSTTLKTAQERLAAVVNAVADVVIGERKLALYARTFSYTRQEYQNIAGAIARISRPDVRLMMKETPHDFFLTHPDDFLAGTIDRPTIIEFDTGAEFNGQGVIANTWPQHILTRAGSLLHRPHVIGYVARTDRYGATRIVGRPSEINLLALKRYAEDPKVTADAVYADFIAARYGRDAVPLVTAAFRNAFDIVTSTLYTLGTNTANHSALDYDPYASSYARSVSGRWVDPPIVSVGHDVNRSLHYWKDIVDYLAPAWAKTAKGSPQLDEDPAILANGWLQAGDRIDAEHFDWVVREKAFGVRQAEASLQSVEQARPLLQAADYQDLRDYFARTLLTARVHRAVAAAYFGFRVYARGEAFRTPLQMRLTREALTEIPALAREIRDYPVKPPVGQWNWAADADAAMRYYDAIVRTGWPRETHGVVNAYAGLTFPLAR